MKNLIIIALLVCGFTNTALLIKARTDIVMMKAEIVDLQQMLTYGEKYD